MNAGTYALILAEEDGPRYLSITVGMAEAQSIAIAIERIVPPRPLTQDLIVSLFKMFNIRLHEVCIHKCVDEIFYAEFLLEKDGHLFRLDSRSSDAVAIALRADCDIFVNEKVLLEAGIELDDSSFPDDDFEDDFEDDDEEDDDGLDDILEGDMDSEEDYVMGGIEPEDLKNEAQLKKWLSLLRDSELQMRMKEAVVNENYEYAKLYKDELSRRGIEGGIRHD
jgi:bifunctional DNase/RNase